VRQREAQLSQARIDLERTAIKAPVDGVVVKRSIEPGQTVAASLQAPELFVIARNLTDMQVETSIDEADVGRIQTGQKASFTVDAFAGRTFSGEVKQVRKAATVVSNVVTYTVVVSASNPDLKLLPGMTANVRIVTAQKDKALKLPNAALALPSAGTADEKKSDGRRGASADFCAAAVEAAGRWRPGRTASARAPGRRAQARCRPAGQGRCHHRRHARQVPRRARPARAERSKAFERNRAEIREKVARS
jgi:HlyD family secretion protein